MINVVMAGDIDVDPANIDALRCVAPDINAVDVVGSVDEMLVRACPDTPIAGLVYGDVAAIDIAGIAERLDAAGDGNGLIVVPRGESPTEDASYALREGAKGVVLKDSPVEELVTAVRAVSAGHFFVPPTMLTALGETLFVLARRSRASVSLGTLTRREADVLSMMALGYPNSEIASKLFISDATARTHVLSILRKLVARNRTEAVVIAHQEGLLEIGVDADVAEAAVSAK